MASKWDPPFWIGDRLFTPADIKLIRWTTDRFGGLSRTELASTICENLPWKAPNGQLRVHECLLGETCRFAKGPGTYAERQKMTSH